MALTCLPVGACRPPDVDMPDGDDSTTDGTTDGTPGPDQGASSGSVSSPSSGGPQDSSGSSGDPGGTTTGGSVDSSGEGSSTGAQVCEPTADDIEGPFYRPDIPVGSNLDLWGDDGSALVIRGQLVGQDCQPLARAIVEIWHATPVPPGGTAGQVEDATYDGTRDYRYYGQVATQADGSFEFQTLRPGWYLNGASYRPAHVHVKVWVRGVERLTTQLYFVGDPFNAGDPWFNPDLALDPDPAGLVELELVV